jgi:hypothetical protein
MEAMAILTTPTPTAPEMPMMQATRWRPWSHRQRPRLYLNASTGRGMTGDGVHFTCAPRLPLRALVDMLPVGIAAVYLCGQLPEAPQVAREDGELYSAFNSWIVGAQPIIEQTHLASGTTHNETFVRLRRSDGGYVELRPVASWVSTNDCTPEDAYEDLALVTHHLRRQYGWQDMCLLSTPAGTGRELWRSSIGWDRKSHASIAYPVLPEDIGTLIHRTSGQGRFELLPPATADGMAPALVYLDGRLKYGGTALGELGIGPAVHDTASAYAGFTPARYRVAFRVPDGWAHLGIFMVKNASGDGWHFPRTPGTIGETWADASELRNALAPFPHTCPKCAIHYAVNDSGRCPHHGWPFTIKERIVFMKGRPLRAWAEKLIAARDACGDNTLARAAIRTILLHTIGAFHGTHRPVTRIAASMDVPNHVPTRLVKSPDGDELHLWEEPGFAPRFPDYDRPEWSSQI